MIARKEIETIDIKRRKIDCLRLVMCLLLAPVEGYPLPLTYTLV